MAVQELKDEAMTDANVAVDEKLEAVVEKENSPEEVAALVLNDIKQNFGFLEKSASSFEPRFALRVLRGLGNLRRRLTADILASAVEAGYPSVHDHESASLILKFIGKEVTSIQVDETDAESSAVLPVTDIYLLVLTQVFLLDQGDYQKFNAFNDQAIAILRSYNRRTLDAVAAKLWFYYAHGKELTKQLVEIRPILLSALRTAALRHDTETRAVLTTLLLRNYLQTQAITQAHQLVLKSEFPQNASTSVFARYLYYTGRIKAIQLEYSDANEALIGAIRKAPQTSYAAGFLQSVNKLKVIIELLMGDIPDRSVFRDPMLEKTLEPYFDLVTAVRVGDVNQFSDIIKKYSDVFKRDGTYMLILRLRQNVIKTGIRMVSLSYSKISLRDICIRLHLDSEESAEYIVAKAIRDGVIEATIDHEKGFMQSKEVLDIYSTQEPSLTFHERIKFCIDLHNESVKAMRYPMNQHRVELKNVEEAREREKELASEIQEGDIEDDDGEFDGL
ncbi:proteasome regulatory subunit C-terminal-domain-containing protein [Lipomyces japonicus]|uniref:proteasome regulatory subunit C-terminal-domain-containing protein n=1 Tax=Lipomyces japonicus TaxID=56871 RepID=UPI0034CF5636